MEVLVLLEQLRFEKVEGVTYYLGEFDGLNTFGGQGFTKLRYGLNDLDDYDLFTHLDPQIAQYFGLKGMNLYLFIGQWIQTKLIDGIVEPTVLRMNELGGFKVVAVDGFA